MKRSTASWTTAIAASALLAMPVGSWAQQPSPTPSQTSRPAGAPMDQKGSANEHLRQAEAALNDIPAASLTGTAKTKVAELKRHLATLGKSASPTPAAGKTSSAPAGKANWSTDVAAADRILTELLGTASTTGATDPGMTGTTGTAKAKPAAKTAAITLDDSAKTKLQEVRTHLTAFAASMSGASASGPSSAPATTPSSDDPSSSASASAAAPASAAASASSSASPTNPASASPTSPASASPSSPASASPSSPASTSPSSPASASAASEAAGSTTSAQMASTAPASQSVDTETVKRHLTAARDSLSQLTQLPAAAQLTGDARTQVSQLISNFNELITTKTEWRASYGKLQANLTALVGDESAAMPAAPATATPGAVGTSGTAAVDPAIRAKLVEFRAHLTEFEKAAGGASAGGASSSASAPAASAAPAATPSPDSTASPTAATTTSSSPTPSAPAAATPSPSAPTEPSPTGTSGTTTPTPAAASSSASTTASVTPKSTEPSDTTSQTSATPAGRQATDAMRHIEAIEAILNGSAETAGTTGSSASKSTGTAGASSLDRVQIEKIRTHLSELRKALNK